MYANRKKLPSSLEPLPAYTATGTRAMAHPAFRWHMRLAHPAFGGTFGWHTPRKRQSSNDMPGPTATVPMNHRSKTMSRSIREQNHFNNRTAHPSVNSFIVASEFGRSGTHSNEPFAQAVRRERSTSSSKIGLLHRTTPTCTHQYHIYPCRTAAHCDLGSSSTEELLSPTQQSRAEAPLCTAADSGSKLHEFSITHNKLVYSAHSDWAMH